MVGQIIRYRALAILLGALVLLTSLASCSGGGGGNGAGGAPSPTPPLIPMGPTALVTGRAHAGTPARPLGQAPCRFVGMEGGQPIAASTTNRAGVFELFIPVDEQGFILCHPANIPNLELSAFISTVGQAEGERLSNEDVIPASAVITDVILANDPLDPQARKEELLAALARGEAEITALVEAATLLYQTLFDDQIGSGVNFSGGNESEGGNEGPAESGGVTGEAGDGGEFSPLPGALCTFSLDAAGLVRANTLLGDLYADGQIDRLDLQAVAPQLNQAIDAERQRAITQAFTALFPIGIGPSLATIADDADSPTPGRYFLPIPEGVPGVVTCIPDTLDNLILHTCVRARAPDEVLEAEDVTPISTVVCEIANEEKRAGTETDRETTKLDLFDRLDPLRIFLSEDRNGNGIQDADEEDKNGDGEFATIVELEADEPLTENNRDLALLASMSTTIFDTLRIEIDDLEQNPSFDAARDDFFTDGEFDETFEPIAVGVESALNDPDNQEVLGTDDVVNAAGTGTLQGRVTDVRGRPVSDVQVVVSQDGVEVAVPDNPAITDVDGRFRIREIPVGETTVRAFLDEFEVLRVTTNVVAVVTITLEIAPIPQLEALPSALVFNEVELGSSRVLAVRLINRGLADLIIDGLAIEGENASAFRFRRRPVLPVGISAGSEVTVDIEYEPAEAASDLAVLRVESNASNAPVLELPLIGTGVERPVPQIELSRTQIDFGEVQLNATQTQEMVVSNSGTAPLTLRSVTLAVDPGSGFRLEQLPALPAVLPPDGELALRVGFQPTRLGVLRGVVRIQSDADDMPNRTVALSGIGVEVPVPEITAEPSVLEFGEAQINVPGEELLLVTRTVTLLNTGTADLILSAVRVDSSQGNEFRLFRPPTLPLTIIPGAGLTLEVQYRPTLVGSVTGAVRIRSNAANVDNLTIPLNGTGVDTRVPRIAVSRSTLDYGEVEIGAARRLSFDVTNTGTGDLVITRFALQSPEGGVFQLIRPPETPFTLVPGATQNLRVRFRPNEAGYATGALRIHNNDVERPRRRISLRGEGVPIPIPQMVVSPEVVAFGEVQVGTSRRLVVTISNPGMADLEITAFEGSVLAGEDFELRRAPRLPVLVRPDAEVDLEVVFRPQREGSVTGTLVIRGTAPDTPEFTVPLYGTATPEPVPTMQVRPRTVDFGEVQERTSQTETITIRNTGTADLTIRSLSITDRSSPDFEIVRAPRLPVEVTPGSHERVRVRYSPSAPGVASGALRIMGDDPDRPRVTVSLNGIGTAEPLPQISVEPTALAFGEVQENRSRRLTLTIRNSGTATLRLTALIIDGDAFRLAETYDVPIPIRTQGAVQLDVVYEPTEPGSDTGTLRIVNNAPETPEVVVALSGYTVPEPKPRIEVDPELVDFADAQVGSRRRLPIRIFNTGTAPLNVTELSVDGGPSGAFTLQDNPAPVTIVEGGSIRVEVNFAPVEEGSVTGTFYAESDADNADGIRVPLSGTGLPEPLPQIDVTPAIVEFPEVEIGASRVETIVIRNTGTDDLIVTDLDIDGGEDNEFRVRRAPTLPVTVLPEGSIEVRVAYVPATAGTATGTLTIANNDPVTPSVIVPLSGVGAPVPTPQVEVSTTTLSFDEVEVGNTRERALIITNVGNATLTIREINVNSEPEGVFGLAEMPSAAGVSTDEINIAPQAEVPIGVVFFPDSVGLVTGTLQLMSNAVNLDVLTVSLDGMGTEAPMPALNASPAALDFGTLEIGRTRTLTVSMLNEGTEDLTISDLELIAADGISFELGAIPELPALVPPDTTVTAEVRFVPETEGSATGIFRIVSNDPDTPETVLPVSGEALPEPVARLMVSPSPMIFGEVRVGTTATLTLSIANEGNADLNVTELTVNSSVDTSFRLGGGRRAPFTVAPGDVETVDIVFAPSETGLVTGTVDIESNASNAPETIVSLRGTGIAPEITLSPDELNFNGVPVGSSRTIPVTALNTGTAALEISAITIEGADFALGAVVAPVTLQPNDTLTFDVIYQPSSPGEASGVVRVSNNSADNPQAEILLSGSGTVPEISVDPDAINFGRIVLEQRAVETVIISNEGAADLDILSVTVEGLAFSVSGIPAGTTTLSPGDTLVADVTFAPLELGEANGSLEIVSNDPASPTRVPLSGTGLPIPVEIEVTPEALEFGAVLLGDSSEMTLTIANPGDAVLSVSDVRVSEGEDVGFALSAPFDSPVDVEPGDDLTVALTFAPAVEGDVSGIVEILSNADNEPVVERSLMGTGTPIPMPGVTVSPDQVNFGPVDVGDQVTAEIDIENTGDADLTVEEVLIAEGADSGFGVTDVPGEPTVLAPGEVLTVTAVFAPAAPGPVTGTLSVISDAANGAEQLVPLQGTGVEVAVPGIEVTPQELAFGGVPVGEDATLSFTIANPGTAVLQVNLELTSTAPEGVFTLEDVPTEVSASEAATVTVRFSPSEVGEVSAAVQITSNADSGDITVEVTGTGEGVPELTISPLAIDFGDVLLGESVTETVQLENTGTGPLVLDTVAIIGDAAFTLETALEDNVLAPGDTLTLEIAYGPTTEGESTGSLEISSNAANGSPQTVALDGNGVPAPEPLIAVTPESVDFGGIEIEETVEADITIENTGDAVLSITEIALTGDSNDDFDLQGGVTEPTDVAPGGQLVVTVLYTPSSLDDASGGVQIVSNAANDAAIVVDLEGTGVPSPVAEIGVTPTAIDFGSLVVGNSDAAEVRIENTGTATLNVDILVINGDTDAFAVDGDTTGPFTLEPGEDMVAVVNFAPFEAGEATATLEISSNANETPQVTVELRGEGI
ncbi:choice-of-anchor D domain-containing protein [Candidatus Entotheonella palauensis]|uniref:choice-of-anchor D domain-containing protein n=1 Tax=Candidatus Entotheonella palauensis TaxID=93172 RepID=UPI000B7D8B11|nr:choice-of-anchor D domain-containing protein [Candidatus Entotheonella palauensis]